MRSFVEIAAVLNICYFIDEYESEEIVQRVEGRSTYLQLQEKSMLAEYEKTSNLIRDKFREGIERQVTHKAVDQGDIEKCLERLGVSFESLHHPPYWRELTVDPLDYKEPLATIRPEEKQTLGAYPDVAGQSVILQLLTLQAARVQKLNQIDEQYTKNFYLTEHSLTEAHIDLQAAEMETPKTLAKITASLGFLYASKHFLYKWQTDSLRMARVVPTVWGVLTACVVAEMAAYWGQRVSRYLHSKPLTPYVVNLVTMYDENEDDPDVLSQEGAETISWLQEAEPVTAKGAHPLVAVTNQSIAVSVLQSSSEAMVFYSLFRSLGRYLMPVPAHILTAMALSVYKFQTPSDLPFVEQTASNVLYASAVSLLSASGTVFVPLLFALFSTTNEITEKIRDSEQIRESWTVVNQFLHILTYTESLAASLRKPVDASDADMDKVHALAKQFIEIFSTDYYSDRKKMHGKDIMEVIASVEACFGKEQGLYGKQLQLLQRVFINPRASPERQAIAAVEVEKIWWNWKGMQVDLVQGMTGDEFEAFLMKLLSCYGPVSELDITKLLASAQWEDKSEELLNLVQAFHESMLEADQLYFAHYDPQIYRMLEVHLAGRVYPTTQEVSIQLGQIRELAGIVRTWKCFHVLTQHGMTFDRYQYLVNKHAGARELEQEWKAYFDNPKSGYVAKITQAARQAGRARHFMKPLRNGGVGGEVVVADKHE